MRLNKLRSYTHKLIECAKNDGVKYTLKKIRRKIKNKRDYTKYIKANLLNELEAEQQRKFDFSRYGNKGTTKFSIIVPLYNTNVIFLRQLIESVQAQTYINWELCFADGSNIENRKEIEKIVAEFTKNDARIKYKKLDKNAGISCNTNAAIGMANGEYLVMLDHDDLLHPSALYENLLMICEKDAEVIYSDEMTFENTILNVSSIHFKPDFAIDNLRANNYICHLMVYKKSLLEKVGMYDSKFDGSQDHDMILRLCEVTNKIEHISRVLYYWRSHVDSVASDTAAKPYVIEAGRGAVDKHLIRCGIKAKVEFLEKYPATYRIKYKILEEALVSIIIPNMNHKEDLQKCIESIQKKSSYKNYEILVIENNSTEENIFEYYRELQALVNVRIIKWEDKFNYSAINNYAVNFAKGQYYIFLNNDVEVISQNWIEEMLMYAQRKDVGAVGAKLYYPNNTIQHAGVILGINGIAGHVHKNWNRNESGYMNRAVYAQNLSAVTGACMMVSKEVFEQIKGFDEQFAVAFNDVDLCLRIRKLSKLIVWNPCAELYHFESKSRGYDSLDNSAQGKRFVKEIQLFKEKWGKQLMNGDPYYNRNFTKKYEDFSVGDI